MIKNTVLLALVLLTFGCGRPGDTSNIADPLAGGCPSGHFGGIYNSYHFDGTHFDADDYVDMPALFSGTFTCDAATSTLDITITSSDYPAQQSLGTLHCSYTYTEWNSSSGYGSFNLYCSGTTENSLASKHIYYSVNEL